MGQVDHVQHSPGPALRGLVGPCSGWQQSGGAPGVHRGLPSPWITLIVTLHEPLVVLEHTRPTTYGTLIGGLHTTPETITHDGNQSGVQVALHPFAARAVLGVPAGALGGNADAVAVAGPWVHELQQRLLDAPSWDSRFAVLDEVLARTLVDVAAPAPELVRAWFLLTRSSARTVEQVAEDVGCSSRHLRAQLLAETGLGPRSLTRVARFDRARRHLGERAAAGARLDLAGLAAAHGYYDQAHLAREFGVLAGSAPSEWVAAEHAVLVPERPSGDGSGRRRLST